MEYGRAKIKHVGVDEQATFVCVRCDASSGCMVCHHDKIPKEVEENSEDPTKDKVTENKSKNAEEGDGDVEMKEVKIDEKNEEEQEDQEEEEEEILRFRCVRCKQEAHYEHRE